MCSTVLRVVLKADETKYLALSNGLVFDSLKHKKEYLQDFWIRYINKIEFLVVANQKNKSEKTHVENFKIK